MVSVTKIYYMAFLKELFEDAFYPSKDTPSDVTFMARFAIGLFVFYLTFYIIYFSC